MIPKTRARRRAQKERAKNRTRRIMRIWHWRDLSPLDPREVGLYTSTHCKPCACSACQADPKSVPKPRERAFDDAEWPEL